MSAPSSPRPLTGLAMVAVVLGLVGAPMVAYADPTSTPTPSTAAAPSPASTDTPSPSAPVSPSPDAPSEADSPSGTSSSSDDSPSDDSPSDDSPSDDSPSDDSPSDDSSSDDSPSDDSSNDQSPSPSPDASTGAPVSGDALAAPGPTQSATPTPTPEVEALAVAGPSITLAKSASPTRVSRVGQVVTYRFVATNNGSVTLNGVQITDELEGLSRITCLQSGATLAPGSVLSCSATLTVTQAVLDFGDIFNSATVFGTVVVPESPETDYVGANAAAHVVVDQRPSIALEGSVSPTGKADRGDRLRYEGTATNTGNVTLTRARIASSLNALDLDCDPSAGATLAPGASISCGGSYRVSAADARRGRVTNTLTARAERPFGDTGSSSDDVTDSVRLRVSVTKLAADSDPGLADTGGPALPVGLTGLVGVAAGLVLLRHARRA